METKFSVRKKWIYLSTALAVFSMFLPWRVAGAITNSGWDLGHFVVLIFWVFPCVNAINKFRWNTFSKVSIVWASIGLIRFMGGEDSIHLLGRTFTARVGAGAYIYAVVWALAIYSEFFLSRSAQKQPEPSKKPVQDIGEDLYLQVTKDFENNPLDEALWAKSMAVCSGDSEKAKYEYIRAQVGKMENEHQKIEKPKQVKMNKTNADSREIKLELKKYSIRREQGKYYYFGNYYDTAEEALEKVKAKIKQTENKK